MRAINHALTGALIGLTVSEPAIALPLALVSHFACDAIPHYDADFRRLSVVEWVSSKKFRRLLYIDALLCFSLVVLLAVRQPIHWPLVALCAFLAAAPDFMELKRFVRARSNKSWQPPKFVQFAEDIQWFHKPIGAVVEVAWFAGACVLLTPWLR